MERIPVHSLLSPQVPDKSAPRLVSGNSDFLSEIQASIKQAADCLISKQRSNGHWVAELEGDTILESEFILMMAFLGREKDPLCLKAAKFIENQQIDGGGWSNYFGGPLD
ncbi:MAG: squalene--hopene cyclase, partial [Planctomycetia bacterium]